MGKNVVVIYKSNRHETEMKSCLAVSARDAKQLAEEKTCLQTYGRAAFILHAGTVDKRGVGGGSRSRRRLTPSQASQTRARRFKRRVLECKMTKRHRNDNRSSGPGAKSRRSERV